MASSSASLPSDLAGSLIESITVVEMPPPPEIVEGVRVRHVYLISREAQTNPVLGLLTSRDDNGIANNYIEAAQQFIEDTEQKLPLNRQLYYPEFEDIEDLASFLHTPETLCREYREYDQPPSYEVKIHSRHDLLEPPILHLLSYPDDYPLFWTPIQVLTNAEDSNAAIIPEQEVDSFNGEQLREVRETMKRTSQTVHWTQVLINPNSENLEFVDIGAIPAATMEASMLKYLGGHLFHAEDLQVDGGFLNVPRAAAIQASPEENRSNEEAVGEDFVEIDARLVRTTIEADNFL